MKLGAVLVAFLLAGCVSSAPAPQRYGAAPSASAMGFLPGVWMAQIDNNAYQMRVNWNAGNARFEGILVRQGRTSQYVGFSVGELVWVAEPTQNPDVLIESQKWRYGVAGVPTGSKWMDGTLNLRNSGPGTLVSSFATFTKISY